MVETSARGHQFACRHSSYLKFTSGIIVATLLLVGVTACADLQHVSILPAPQPPPAACIVVDQDGNLDDIRALAVLQPHRRIAAVIGTDGIVSAKIAASTAANFLGANSGTIVVEGFGLMAGSPAPPDWTWLRAARTAAERLPALFTARTPALQFGVTDRDYLGPAIAAALKDCASIGLIITGPWSSFIEYQSSISEKLAFVVAQGRSPKDPDDPTWDRVNCSFDRRACERAITYLHSTPLFWVDLPAAGPPYYITSMLVDTLAETGVGGKMKQAMHQDDQWQGQQIWDEGAALFVINPVRFKQVGQHIEPIPGPADFLLQEAKTINGSDR